MNKLYESNLKNATLSIMFLAWRYTISLSVTGTTTVFVTGSTILLHSTFPTNFSLQEAHVLYHVLCAYSHAWSLWGLFFQRQWTSSSAFGYYHSLQLLCPLLHLLPRRHGLRLQLGACYSHALHLLVGEALDMIEKRPSIKNRWETFPYIYT